MKYSLHPLSVEASLELPLDISQHYAKLRFQHCCPGFCLVQVSSF